MNRPINSYVVPTASSHVDLTVTADTTLGIASKNILIDTSTADITVTLPFAHEAAGLIFYISLVDSSSGTYKGIVIANPLERDYPNLLGGLDRASFTMVATTEWVLLYSTGRYWVVLNSYEVP